MAMIKGQWLEELYSSIAAWDRRRVAAGHPGVMATAAEYRDKGFTPYRFRVDLRRAAVSRDWLNGLQDTVPGVTDAAIDTAMRSTLARLAGGHEHWLTSEPLKR